jgi:hypothetical protein
VVGRYDLHMTTHNFRVPNFRIRGCSLTKRQMTAIVRKVIRERNAATTSSSLATKKVAPHKTPKRK